jgi:hypothetical protein
MMKPRILSILACAAALLPFTPLEARTFGGFEPTKKFKLTVKKVTSVKRTGFAVIPDAPIPAGIPDYALGEKVRFTIGRRGELKALGLNIAFKNGNRNVNNYLNQITLSTPDVQGAGIGKSVTGQPKNMIINYQKVETPESSPVIYNVSYILKK